VSHPSLGLPPRDLTAGAPAAAARVRDAAPRLAARALEVAIDRDPTLRERNDEAGLRGRLRDAELLAERVALALATDDVTATSEYADWTAPVYRRKAVPLDDLISLCEGLRAALPSVLAPHGCPSATEPSMRPSSSTAGTVAWRVTRARRTPCCSSCTRAVERR
jgi:hypothetical protein